MREELLVKAVEDCTISPAMTVDELLACYEKAHGFMAGHLAAAVRLLEENKDADLRVIAFTANLVATGIRGVIAQLVKERVFNLIVTTCGTVDHDVARSTGGKYFKGAFTVDDVKLREAEIHRLGNIFIPLEDYGPRVEKFVHSVLSELEERRWGVYEILWELGKRVNDENSILRACYETKTPMIVPGYLDGAFGTALFTYAQIHRGFVVDPFKDQELMAELVFKAKKMVALIVGGGISKHHTIWWAQFRGGLDAVVYLTTAVEYDGSLSGAHPREAITWGKLKPHAQSVVVYGDATLILPIMAAGLLRSRRRSHP